MLTTKSQHGNVTFRFKNETLNQLRKEAEHNRISLNTLASQIFQSHVEYHKYSSQAGMVSFPKSLLVRIMNRLSEREVESLSEHIAKNEIKDMTRLMKSAYSLSAFLDVFESWLRVSGFAYKRETIDNSEIFVVQHEMGRRWSIYFEKLIEYVFKDLNENKPSFEVTDNSVAFKINDGLR